MISAQLSQDGPTGTFDLTLTWLAGRAAGTDFASSVVLLDTAGRELYRPRYAPSSREHEILWPLFDDALPPSLWKPGQSVIERYRFRHLGPWLSAPSRLSLVLFERRDSGAWQETGIQEVPLKTS